MRTLNPAVGVRYECSPMDHSLALPLYYSGINITILLITKNGIVCGVFFALI